MISGPIPSPRAIVIRVGEGMKSRLCVVYKGIAKAIEHYFQGEKSEE
jgi:hypothetical protein